MKKYRVTWWETNRWETTVMANSKEEAIEKVKNFEDDTMELARETDDSWVESGDYEAEEVKDE